MTENFFGDVEGISLILDNLLDALIIIDREGRIRLVNKPAEKMFGYPAEDMYGQSIGMLMPHEYAKEHGSYIQRYLDTGEARVIGVGREVEAKCKDGSFLPVNLAITEAYFEGELHFIGTLRDLTLQRQADEKIEELAHYDSITGLPNRTLMLSELNKLLKSRDVAITMLNLDYFNRINVVFGYREGKNVLREVAKRFQMTAEHDEFVVKDIEDKFWIVSRNTRATDEHAIQRAEAFISSIKAPIELNGMEHYLTASAGVAMAKRGSHAPRELANADSAAQESKARGRDRVTVYRKLLTSRVIDDFRVENGLRKALKESKLLCWLQSKIGPSGEVTSAEALVRWERRPGEIMSPASFLPVADRFGIINDIGDIIARQVAKALKAIIPSKPEFRIAINVSPKQFLTRGFSARIRRIFDEEGVSLSHLTIEITEHLLSMELDYVHTVMQELSDEGVQFSIDDFGTGYSNLIRIKQLPLSELKIDKEFVDAIQESGTTYPLVDTILMMGQSLKLNTVSEGVEHQCQAEYLFKRGCNELQGFLYAKPTYWKEWLRDNGFDSYSA